MIQKVVGYRCSVCGEEYPYAGITYNCPNDGGNLDVILDLEAIQKATSVQNILTSRDFSMWRYLPLLPVDEPGFPDTPLRKVGWTPVYRPPRLAEELELGHLWIKDESSNPTASFKDRASALLVARAVELEAEVIVTASSGNAGAALAGMAAATGQKAVILVPKSAPPPKIAQLLVYGAEVLLVDGNYDDAFELALEASQQFGWYCRNTGFNPYTAEGKKTAALEIWEQVLTLGDFSRPLSVFVSVGDGNIIAGIHKGFKDLLELGWLQQMPKLFGVQAEGAAAVANAFNDGVESIDPVKADTLADSISVDLPRDGLRAVRAAAQTGGSYIKVSDAQILKAITLLGRAGIFAEPAGAAGYAGLVKAREQNIITDQDPVLVMVTGSGLKDTQTAVKAVGEPPVIAPTIKALKEVVKI